MPATALAFGVKLYAAPTATVVDGVPEIDKGTEAGLDGGAVTGSDDAESPELDPDPQPVSTQRHNKCHTTCDLVARLLFTIMTKRPVCCLERS